VSPNLIFVYVPTAPNGEGGKAPLVVSPNLIFVYVPTAPNGEGGEVPKSYSAKTLDIQG